MIKIFRALYLFLNIAIILALLFIHFVYKENSHQSSLLYYTLPLPVIILAVLILSILLYRKFRKFNFLLAALLLLIWLGRSFKIHFAEDITETDLEIVYWNASRESNFKEAFNVYTSIPDIMVLVEARRINIKSLQLEFPDYHFYLSTEEIAIFSKTPIEDIKKEENLYRTTVINFKVRGIRFYAVDITASLDVPRAWGLDFVNSQIKNKKNTIILGDFNAPYESKYLDEIKAKFNHAFTEKGNGFRETWFWNIPFLSIDHIWVSKDLKILKTEKISTFKSDHSMLKTVIRK